MLRAPTIDYFDRSIVALDRELHPVHGIAGFDLRKKPGGNIEVRRGLVEVLVDLREERNVFTGHRLAPYQF
jgi:hypothetical protein